MKIVEISDYDRYNSCVAHGYFGDQEVIRLYEFDEYRMNRAAIKFSDRMWFVGCAPKLIIKFDNGATETFDELTDGHGHVYSAAVNAAMKRISDLLLSNDEPEPEPETDMPDIF